MNNDLISRQAAIDALHMHLMYRMGTDSNKKRLDEWINNLPSAQPETHEERTETHACDLIDRQAAIDAIYHHLPSVSRTRARTMLHEVPSAQPDSKELSFTHKSLDTVSRQEAIEVIDAVFPVDPMKSEYAQGIACGAALAKTYVEQLPSVQK